MRPNTMVIAVQIGQRCCGTVAHGLDLANEDAMAARRNDLFDRARENSRTVDLRRGSTRTITVDAGKPVLDQMVIAACEAIGKVMPVLRQDIDAKIAIDRYGLGDPAA